MRYIVCGRPWFLGLASVVFLTMSNITLLLRSHSARPHTDESIEDQNSNCTIHEKQQNYHIGRWDNKRQYLIYDFAYSGEGYARPSKKSEVCIATLTTPDRLFWLPQVVSHWSGPISLAVFVKDTDQGLFISYFRYLQHCHKQVLSNVTLHIVRPGRNDVKMDADAFFGRKEENTENMVCSSPSTVMKAMLKGRFRPPVNKGVPQNHLRNLARKGCPSSFILTIDIDIIPSHGAAEQLSNFLGSSKMRNCEKCAYVIPTYELDDHLSFPKSKEDLLSFEKKGRARPFHEKVFIHNQHATNFSRWRSSSNSSKVHVSHLVTEFEFFYEPFYVSKDTTPSHDERFIGYGFTRNTQVYEMFLSGWNFQVLSPVFLIHWGLQKRSTRPGWREKENSNNRFLFANFKRELVARYKLDSKKSPVALLQT